MLKAQQDFINLVLPGAKKAHSAHRVLPSLTLCQGIIESAWGKKAIGNNLFGIKAGASWQGKKQLVWTHEYENGQRIKIQDYFRDYDSIEESILDHAKLLTLTRYKPVLAAKDYKEACIQVQKCGYATDPKYSQKLIDIIEKYELYKYDEVIMTKYSKIAFTHVVEIDPLNLRISIEDKPANKITLPNFVTSIFQMLQANGETYPLGILVSEGKVLANRQPHKLPAGTLIVYKDGSVTVKPILDITKEPDVYFAVSGCSILPKIRMKEEGFIGKFADVGRSTSRPVIGYNPTTNKIIIAVRPYSSIARGMKTLVNLGCTMGITLDGGGSTVLRVDSKYKVNTTRQLYAVITWV